MPSRFSLYYIFMISRLHFYYYLHYFYILIFSIFSHSHSIFLQVYKSLDGRKWREKVILKLCYIFSVYFTSSISDLSVFQVLSDPTSWASSIAQSSEAPVTSNLSRYKHRPTSRSVRDTRPPKAPEWHPTSQGTSIARPLEAQRHLISWDASTV